MFEKIITGIVTATYVAVGATLACVLVADTKHAKKRDELTERALDIKEREVAVEEAKLAAAEHPAE